MGGGMEPWIGVWVGDTTGGWQSRSKGADRLPCVRRQRQNRHATAAGVDCCRKGPCLPARCCQLSRAVPSVEWHATAFASSQISTPSSKLAHQHAHARIEDGQAGSASPVVPVSGQGEGGVREGAASAKTPPGISTGSSVRQGAQLAAARCTAAVRLHTA